MHALSPEAAQGVFSIVMPSSAAGDKAIYRLISIVWAKVREFMPSSWDHVSSPIRKKAEKANVTSWKAALRFTVSTSFSNRVARGEREN